MFSNTHSVLLVLLVITCLHSHTAGKDEFMTYFCLKMDTPEHMDSSTVQGRKNSTHFSYLATKSPVPQDYTEEELHTVTSHGISATTHPAQQDYKKKEEASANRLGLCCFEFHKRPIPASNVVSYEETRSDCTLPGVILTTKRGFRICVDPEVDWVQQVIKNPNTPDMCCFRFEKNESHVTSIKMYKETATECSNPGVIFILQTGHEVCADPGDEWVKNNMKKLDQHLFRSSTQPQPTEPDKPTPPPSSSRNNGNGPNICCFSYQTRQIHVRYIKGYEKTEHWCAKPGLIFTLNDGRKVCADPGVEWVKDNMKQIDQRLT